MSPSIAENLRRINRETSLRLSSVSSGARPATRQETGPGRMKILAAALGAFARSLFMKRNIARGKEGLITAGGEAMEALVQAVKEWELAYRRSEGGIAPPVSEAEVGKISSRYASWTAP